MPIQRDAGTYRQGAEHYHSDSSRPLDGPPSQIAWQQTTTRDVIEIPVFSGMVGTTFFRTSGGGKTIGYARVSFFSDPLATLGQI